MENQEPKKKAIAWWKLGLYWGIFMQVFNLLTKYLQAEAIDLERLYFTVPFWLLSGLLFGYVGRRFNWL